MKNPLFDLLIDKIKSKGPISIEEYMEVALTHPEFGYYRSQKPIGKDGDFITAPEISQMFGELCGLWGLDQIINQNIINQAEWVEFGPGRGTFMSDIIRACYAAMPTKEDLWIVNLFEVHEGLIKQQQEKLSKVVNLKHFDDFNDLPQKPLLFIANEFFDALPIRQYISKGPHWYERCVTLKNESLSFMECDSPTENINFPKPRNDNEVLEYSPKLSDFVGKISKHINEFGGAALIIDYGKESAIGDTLQAVRDHKPVDILENPGECDLSAWVDFSAIKQTANAAGTTVFGSKPQGEFLKQLGLFQRAEQLGAGATAEERRKIVAAVDRLTSPAQMGNVFRVMAILPRSFSEISPQDIPGFANNDERT